MKKYCVRCGTFHDINYRCIPPSNGKHADTTASRIRRSRRWNTKAKSIKSRDSYLCQHCLSKGILTTRDLSVHHIIPINQDETKAFDDSNLITLCRRCHDEAEDGRLGADYLLDLLKDKYGYD